MMIQDLSPRYLLLIVDQLGYNNKSEIRQM